ncbi:alpha/beta hydrolase [Streptomyces sp. V4-01]|uniref:Alpha/beta hydrolase n=1 Tax=Actinacidiphila polyblastidii TaxID=3110430 RepID=A0ABU7PIL0_9ACTN|nr:alpha/beta hydrolase [Streptomyces sp. V4-01]
MRINRPAGPSRARPLPSRLSRGSCLLATVCVVAASALPALTGSADAATERGAQVKPTIVLVHGAFADASGWSGVVTRLEHDGYPVVAPANPLRGLTSDSAYVASIVAAIKGPVVLVGHSYGGAVISEAAAGNPHVRALVYIAAFMPDTGEQLGVLNSRFAGSQLAPALLRTPVAGGGTDFTIDPAAYHHVFAQDLSAADSRLMAVEQRPLSSAAFTDQATTVAWHTIPSWYLVAEQDRSISPDLERFEAARAHSHTTQVDSSHVAMISHPGVSTRVIEAAATSTAP